MKTRRNLLQQYQSQKEIARFYKSATVTILVLFGFLLLWTAFRTHAKEDPTYILGMLWYIIPIFLLAIISGLNMFFSKRDEKRTFKDILDLQYHKLHD